MAKPSSGSWHALLVLKSGRRFLNLPSLRPVEYPAKRPAEPTVASPTEAVGVGEIFKESGDLVKLHFKQIPLVSSEWSACGAAGGLVTGAWSSRWNSGDTWSERSAMPCLGGQEGESHPGSYCLVQGDGTGRQPKRGLLG